MGREASSRRLRRVVRALSTQEAAALPASAARQYRVRVRTLRRAVTWRLTGTPSLLSCALALSRLEGGRRVSQREAIEWAAGVRASHAWWDPLMPVPAETPA